MILPESQYFLTKSGFFQLKVAFPELNILILFYKIDVNLLHRHVMIVKKKNDKLKVIPKVYQAQTF